jgi:hypothetical protein
MTTKNNDFTKRPQTLSRLNKLGDGEQVVVVTRAFGPGGEELMDTGTHRFSGEPGIRLRVRQGDVEDDVILSPFFGDPSKVYTAPFKDGVACELLCPQTGRLLDRVPGMKTEDGGDYYAVYLTSRLADGELVAINDIWGNPHSRLMSEGEILRALAEMELAPR